MGAFIRPHPINRGKVMTGTKEGCLILIGILLAITAGAFCQALDEPQLEEVDDRQTLGLIHDLMRERPVYMLQALSNFGARFPNAASKRGIDFGLGRGFSGSQAAKHFMGMAAARYSGGPGKKRKRSQYLP